MTPNPEQFPYYWTAYRFTPQPDITVFELATIVKNFDRIGAIELMIPSDPAIRAEKGFDIWMMRHFTLSRDQGDARALPINHDL